MAEILSIPWAEQVVGPPFAPPRLSDPLNVEADAHAAETVAETDSPEERIDDFKLAISLSLKLAFPSGIGSCQMRSSSGTSGPR